MSAPAVGSRVKAPENPVFEAISRAGIALRKSVEVFHALFSTNTITNILGAAIPGFSFEGASHKISHARAARSG